MKTVSKWTLLSLFAALVFGAAVSAAPKIFKWTDADGQVHFGSAPPPGQTAQKVRILKSVDAPAAPVDAPTAAGNGKADAAKPAITPEQRAELVKYCTAMRERISTLKQGGRVVEKNPDGSKNDLDAAAVTSKLREDEGNVRSYCTSNGV
jgi:hypothetical protein